MHCNMNKVFVIIVNSYFCIIKHKHKVVCNLCCSEKALENYLFSSKLNFPEFKTNGN